MKQKILLLLVNLLFVYANVNGMMQSQNPQKKNKTYYNVHIVKPDGQSYVITYKLKRKQKIETVITFCCAPLICVAYPCICLLQCIKKQVK
ncbi:hypothetical protein ACFLYU_03465 [Candidatus Dependentiae bacterium]